MIQAKTTAKDIDEYIATFPTEIQNLLEIMRATIKKAAPEAFETISYQMPTFKLKTNLVHFAAYKHHIGFYPGASAIETFKNDLMGYKTSKGTVQFPIDKPLPIEIISKIVLFKLIENSEKAKRKKK
ncbi:MAG: DUF1801 domain-containing protein [Paludibacter sp.]